MTTRKMDLIVTGIEPDTEHAYGRGIVWYGFPVGDAGILCWRIPHTSTFDLSTIQVGKRYEVDSVEISLGNQYHSRLRKVVPVIRYDWISVRELMPRQKTSTMSSKQSKAAKQTRSMKLADDGLFDWNPKV